jgi:succinate---hydroxymethylglutarate CoA-transferase
MTPLTGASRNRQLSSLAKHARGIRVLDLTRILAGPTATMLLADLGADVIKVEEVKHGDDTIISFLRARTFLQTDTVGSWSPPAAPFSENAPKATPHLPPESAYFLAVNINKRSITVNFKKPKGLEIVHQLVAKADILVENFLPGKLDTMGLGYPDCSVVNDRLIYASITGTFVLLASPLSVDIDFPRLWTNRSLSNSGGI